MAYQNVGSNPRFYIDYLQFAMANGTGSSYYSPSPLGLNVSKQYSYSTDYTPPDIYKTFQIFDFTGAIQKLNYVAILGHNLGSFNTGGFHMRLDRDTVTDYVEYPSDYQIVNVGFSGDNFHTQGNGFSIVKITEPSTPEGADRIVFRLQGSEGHNIKVSALSTGSIYDMPHSPDLKLTMSREMDGVKRSRTLGGADLVKHQYIKPPPWGSAAPWELYTGTPTEQKLSRIGRRVWDLSFSYISDSDVFPMLSSLNPYESESDTGVPYSSDPETTWHDGETLLDDNTFYSQVIHKTNGGQLPFIFNPAGGGDNPINTPDMFAICKFDMSSFKFSQVANGVYNVKLKIREVW